MPKHILIENETFEGAVLTEEERRHHKRNNIDGNAYGLLDAHYRHYRRCTFLANDVAEGFKLSHCSNIILEECNIIGGYEDCLDVVNSHDIAVIRPRLYIRGWYAATIKGYSNRINIDSALIYGTPNHGAIFDLGNHTIYYHQGHPYTRYIRIANTRQIEGSARCLVRSWRSRSIELHNNEGSWSKECCSMPWIVWWPWFFWNELPYYVGIKSRRV